MKHIYRHITDRYLFRLFTSLALAGIVALSAIYGDIPWTCLLYTSPSPRD